MCTDYIDERRYNMKGLIHTHSENSLKDSAMSVKVLCKTAKEKGYTAVALTDHGTLTGIYDFMDDAKEVGIKPIPGVEAYYNHKGYKRAHLVLLAKNYEGFKAISRAVTASNHAIEAGFPCMNKDVLTKHFGEGSEGHGNVIATSACMGGVLSVILLKNFFIDKEVEKLERRQSRYYNPASPQYKAMKKKYEADQKELEVLSAEISTLTPISKKPYVRKKQMVEALKGTPEHEVAQAKLAREIKETESAAKKLLSLRPKKASLSRSVTVNRNKLKVIEEQHKKWHAVEVEKETLRSSKKDKSELIAETEATALFFEKLFGKGNFFIELQYHGIPEEKEVMPTLAKIAKNISLPVSIANDSHIPTNSKDDLKARQIMRSLRFNKWEEPFVGDDELYIKTPDENRTFLSSILPEDTIDEGFANVNKIVDACDVEFPTETHYPVFPVKDGETSHERLRRLAENGKRLKFPKGWTKEYQDRLEMELEIIQRLGFDDYLCIVEDFIRYGDMLGRLEYVPSELISMGDLEKAEKGVGVGVGPGRGSAVGSLVCYLTGITNVDPIKYGLLFERFLNPERVTMPDIDSDFRPDIRDKVIDYVKAKYGEDAVCSIMTKGTQQARAAIRNAARLLGSQKKDDTRSFLGLADEICSLIPNELDIKIADCEELLRSAFEKNKNAQEIIDNAKLTEGVFTNIGMHAAAVIIADNGDVAEYVPLMYIEGKDRFATQCDMMVAEGLGLLKMDFLGLKNLGIINDAVRDIQKRYGKVLDINKAPFDANVFKNIFAEGNTNSVFQFESSGMKAMLKQFKPEKFEDIILLVAAYRPGPLQYLDSIIAVKNGSKKPSYIVPEMKSILGETYGSPVYQEQIMQIFNKFAGFSLGEADIIRRYMSKKKTEDFLKYKDRFVQGMIKSGAKQVDAEEFWEQLVEFSRYAFNKSHAAVYALLAYQTAYLKYHYPKEYIASAMRHTDFDKIGMLIGDAKKFGVSVFPPSINLSENTFAAKDEGIICGLSPVKEVAKTGASIIEERERGGRFTSFKDFLTRCNPNKGAIENLIYAGALDEFTHNRKALAGALEEYFNILKKLKEKQKTLSDASASEKRLENAKKSVEKLMLDFDGVLVDTSDEDVPERLSREKKSLGAFISGHPVDGYDVSREHGFTPTSDVVADSRVMVAGAVTNLRIVNRKSDGAQMAFFDLEDTFGSIECCVFAKEYAKFRGLIKDDVVLKIKGDCAEQEFNGVSSLSILAKQVYGMVPTQKEIVLEIRSIPVWAKETFFLIRPYLDSSGAELILYDKLTSTFRKTELRVNSSILKDTRFQTVS